MLAPNLPTEPYWLDLPRGVRVEIQRVTTAIMPLSPVHLAGSRDDAGNLTITWIRRTRIPAGWSDGADVPLGEASEHYEVDIRNAADTATLRTIGTNSPTAAYAAAEQIGDFGAPQSTIRVRVQQISDTVGRGIAREAIL